MQAASHTHANRQRQSGPVARVQRQADGKRECVLQRRYAGCHRGVALQAEPAAAKPTTPGGLHLRHKQGRRIAAATRAAHQFGVGGVYGRHPLGAEIGQGWPDRLVDGIQGPCRLHVWHGLPTSNRARA